MKVPEASCYPRVLFSELYGATFHRGQTGEEGEGKGGDGKGPRFFQCRMVLSSADRTESSPRGCSVNGNLVRKKHLIHPDRICLLH